MAERLSNDMKELLDLLNRHQAQYLVIGGHACSVYTEPRTTKDLDVWVNPTPENASRVYAALQEFGAPHIQGDAALFTDKESFLVIGRAPNRIDILMDIPGVEFEPCWRRRQVLDIGGVEANFPSLKDLYAAKLAANRPQDLADAAKLRKAIALEQTRAREKSPGVDETTRQVDPKEPGLNQGLQLKQGR